MYDIVALKNGEVQVTVSEVNLSDGIHYRNSIAEYFNEQTGEEFIAIFQAKLNEARAMKFVTNSETLKKKKEEAATLAKEIEQLEKECGTK